jgi:hypothetical protein
MQVQHGPPIGQLRRIGITIDPNKPLPPGFFLAGATLDESLDAVAMPKSGSEILDTTRLSIQGRGSIDDASGGGWGDTDGYAGSGWSDTETEWEDEALPPPGEILYQSPPLQQIQQRQEEEVHESERDMTVNSDPLKPGTQLVFTPEKTHRLGSGPQEQAENQALIDAGSRDNLEGPFGNQCKLTIPA